MMSALLSLAVASSILGQTAAAPADPLKNAKLPGAEAVSAQMTRKALTDPSLTLDFMSSLEALKFEAKQDDKTATAVISHGEVWHLKLTAPLDKSASATTLANLHGLGGKGKAELGFKHVISEWDFEINQDTWNALCLSHELEPGCTSDKLTQVERDQAIQFTGLKTMLGGSFEYTKTKFKWAEKPTYEQQSSKTHPQYAATIAYGILPIRNHIYFASLGFRYESSFEEQDKGDICLPVKDSKATQCSNIALGAPDHKQKRALELKALLFFRDKLRVAPVVAYDLKGSTLGIDVPFSFIPGEKGLNGGIDLGWRSDKKELTAGVFIGVLEELFK